MSSRTRQLGTWVAVALALCVALPPASGLVLCLGYVHGHGDHVHHDHAHGHDHEGGGDGGAELVHGHGPCRDLVMAAPVLGAASTSSRALDAPTPLAWPPIASRCDALAARSWERVRAVVLRRPPPSTHSRGVVLLI